MPNAGLWILYRSWGYRRTYYRLGIRKRGFIDSSYRPEEPTEPKDLAIASSLEEIPSVNPCGLGQTGVLVVSIRCMWSMQPNTKPRSLNNQLLCYTVLYRNIYDRYHSSKHNASTFSLHLNLYDITSQYDGCRGWEKAGSSVFNISLEKQLMIAANIISAIALH